MNNLKNKKLPVWLIIGIVLFPIIFAWFTLKGYSKKAQIISFAWAVVSLLFVALLPTSTVPPAPVAKPQKNEQAVEPIKDTAENELETIKGYDKKITAVRTHGENVLEIDLPATEAFSDAGYLDYTSRTTRDILIKILNNPPKQKFTIIRFVVFADLTDQYNNKKNEPIFQLTYDYTEIQKINISDGYVDHRLFLNFAKFGLRSPVAHEMFEQWCTKGDNAERSGRFCQ